MTDIEIANKAQIKPIETIANDLGIPNDLIELYGKHKCKVNSCNIKPQGKLVLVTAINPTPLGEGKTTVTIGLADGIRQLGYKSAAALREPSLGPLFGMKGGATGGGYSQVIPMSDINLHFNGDFHAITSANNLLSAAIDNHIYQGNTLNINPDRIIWQRCMDMNDRNLRSIKTGLGRQVDGVTLDTGFNITAASEIMAILCLSKDIEDLKNKLANITIAYDMADRPIYASQLRVENAMTILLKEAIKPNLVQTLEGTPVFIHGGPFANIAHGCNSIIATKTAMHYADYCITEAGFGSDLGMEKFIDVKLRQAKVDLSCVVLVATIKAIKYNAGVSKDELYREDIESVAQGFLNLRKHIENIKNVFKLPCVVAINRFSQDTDSEISELKKLCLEHNTSAIEMTAYSEGGKGASELANEVIKQCERESKLTYAYELNDPIITKLNKIVTKIYGGLGVRLSEEARLEIERLEEIGMGSLPIIVAKTQYSLSDDPKLLNSPTDFYLNVRKVELRSGAGFIIAIAGDIMLMPGLPKIPSYEQMNINSDGVISGMS